MTDEGGVKSLLEDDPELRSAVGDILLLDEEMEMWGFEDASIDSGDDR